MLESRSKVIGNYTYHVRHLTLSKARPALVRVQRVLLPVLAEAVSAPGAAAKLSEMLKAKAKVSVLDADISVLLPALGSGLKELALRLDEGDLEVLCEIFAEVTEIEREGKRLPLTKERQETHFMGKTSHMLRWLSFAVEVNFGDFLGESLAASLGQTPATQE